MRINSYIAKSTAISRRKAESYIKTGRVLINGQKAKLTDRVSNSQTVTLDGKVLKFSKKSYYLVYKPVGFVSTVNDPHAKKKVVDLVPQEDGLFPVGRLDKNSEGLMILTNDGDLAQKLTHPRYAHEKEYLVTVKLPNRNISQSLEDALKFFKCGIRLDGKKTNPAQIKLLSQIGNTATFEIILTQGLFRQIRRTFEKAGLSVIKLLRVRISQFRLGDLEPGEAKKIDINPVE